MIRLNHYSLVFLTFVLLDCIAATHGVAWSVSVCVCVSVGHVQEPCEKRLNGEPIEMPFEELTHVGPRKHILDAVKVGRIHSPP